MVASQSIDLEFPRGEARDLECKLCGYTPIKFGFTICRGCKQPITYVNRTRLAKPSIIKDGCGMVLGTIILWTGLVFGIAFVFGRQFSWIASALFVVMLLGVTLAYFQKRKEYYFLRARDKAGFEVVRVIFGENPKSGSTSITTTGFIAPIDNN